MQDSFITASELILSCTSKSKIVTRGKQSLNANEGRLKSASAFVLSGCKKVSQLKD